MSWITGIGQAIIGVLTALPDIVSQIKKWMDSSDIKKKQDDAAKIDETATQGEKAKTDEERKSIANKWADIIRNIRK